VFALTFSLGMGFSGSAVWAEAAAPMAGDTTQYPLRTYLYSEALAHAELTLPWLQNEIFQRARALLAPQDCKDCSGFESLEKLPLPLQERLAKALRGNEQALVGAVDPA